MNPANDHPRRQINALNATKTLRHAALSLAIACSAWSNVACAQSVPRITDLRASSGSPVSDGRLFAGEEFLFRVVDVPSAGLLTSCRIESSGPVIVDGGDQLRPILLLLNDEYRARISMVASASEPIRITPVCEDGPSQTTTLEAVSPQINLELNTTATSRADRFQLSAILQPNPERRVRLDAQSCRLVFQGPSGAIEQSAPNEFPFGLERAGELFANLPSGSYNTSIRCTPQSGNLPQLTSNPRSLLLRDSVLPAGASLSLVTASLSGAPGDVRTIEARVTAPPGVSVADIPITLGLIEPRSVNLRGARALSPRLTTSSNGTVTFPAALLNAGTLGYTLGAGGLTVSGSLAVQSDSRSVQITPSALALRAGETARVQLITQAIGASGQSFRLSYPPGLSGPSSATVNAAGEAIITVQAQAGSGGNLRAEFGTPAVVTEVPVTLLAASATPAPALIHRTGLYANAAEPGYGLMLTQAGAKIVVAWYTFGLDGKPLWLLIPGADPQADGSYTGPLFRFRGIPFDKITSRADVAQEQLGTATLRFNGNGLSFAYQLLGVSQTKQLTRFRLSNAPAPVCAPSNGRRLSSNASDVWWNPAEPGWGMSMSQEGNDLFLAWYTYGPDDFSPVWIAGQGQRGADGVFRGTLFSPASGRPFSQINNQAATTFPLPTVGQFDLTFDNGETAGFGYTAFNRPRQEKGIVRFNFGSPATNCF